MAQHCRQGRPGAGQGELPMSFVMEGMALDDPFRAVIEEKVPAVLEHGRVRPTQIRVAFTDENGPKGGVAIRCALTVELPRRPPTHASAVAENRRLALDGALEALDRLLVRERQRRRELARRPKKYFVAEQGHQPDGEAALPPPRRRRRSA
jgi:ribosome-associated translation inhibitor RaiA